ncbi:UPF0481 protein At3g47200-like [Quercus lobata]|uniref:UPF0481 protein At3g47200-like n=1 Tax=Quercus lobata TaxID=97700 RepID=UPI001248330E|nr:UPF0481 protein At3g47200-like [Quercus lobata]
MAGKDHVISIEGFFRREAGACETSSAVTEDAQTHSISIESTSTNLEAKINTVMEARKKVTPSPAPKIRKVIFVLRDHKDFKTHYEPKAVSLGPIHHGIDKYQLGEQYKLVLTYEFVKGSKEKINYLYKKIGKKINELRDCFEKEVTKSFDDEDLIWRLLVDGCAILQYIYYAAKNKFTELNIKPDSIAFTRQDLFLLENQLSYRLLKWLMSWSENEADLKESIDTYIDSHVTVPLPEDHSSSKKKKDHGDHVHAIHLLDLLRTRLVHKHQQKRPGKSTKHVSKDMSLQSYRNVQELRAVGIHVERSKKENSCLSDISFTALGCLGFLWLPPITVDDSTRPKFLNLIAYEMCLDFQNDFEITSYISFVDSLIDEANDVKMLRKAGILYNCLGSDEHVAKLFNEIGTGLVPNSEIYSNVRVQIQKHYKNQLMTWLAQVCHDHFSSPLAFLAFFGALLALALIVIQTWYAVKPTPGPCYNFCKNFTRN